MSAHEHDCPCASCDLVFAAMVAAADIEAREVREDDDAETIAMVLLARRLLDPEAPLDAFDDLSRWFGEAWMHLPSDAIERLEMYRTTQPFGAC